LFVRGDSACRDEQSNQAGGVRGFYGNVYAELHNLTNDQALGNICAGNFSQEMSDLGTGIKKRALDIPLACIPGDLQLTFDDPGQAVNFSINPSTKEVEFVEPLAAGTCLKLVYACPSI